MVFGKMIGFAFRATWSLFKVLMYIVFLPLILVGMVFGIWLGAKVIKID